MLDRRPTFRRSNAQTLHEVTLTTYRREFFRWLAGLGFLLLAATSVRAQTTTTAVPTREPPRVFLVTIGPGEDVYELYGHNALLVFDPAARMDVLYNWGVFDFQQEQFIWRFIQGRMLYSMQGEDPAAAIAMYRERGRSVRLRELDLSPAQLRRLADLCAANDTDAARDYRYDYYRDNCSTRVRDMLDTATGGQLALKLRGTPALTPDGSPATYRWHTDRLTQRSWWLYVALQYVLGHPVDRPIDRWEEGFLPLKLETHLAGLSVKWEDGRERPLLGAETVLVPPRFDEPAAPPRAGWMFALAGVVGGGAVAGLAWLRGRWARCFAGLGVAGWAGLCTLAGGISTWGWLFTDHVVSRQNENWLQLSPVSLPMVVAGLMCATGRAPRWGVYVAYLTLGLSLAGSGLHLLPGMNQPNGAILLLATPIHIGVLLAVRTMVARRCEMPAAAGAVSVEDKAAG